MLSIRRLLGFGAGGLLVARLGGARAGGGGEPADGVGCPATISGALSANPSRIQRGKVLGLQFRLDRIADWGDAEEIHVGFTFPTGEAHEAHRRRALKAFKKPQAQAQANGKARGKGQVQAKGKQQQPVKATAGGGGEEEHAPFIYRNSNVKPKLVPKEANRATFEPHDGIVEWHLEKGMTYSAPAYRFLAFGKVEKEWELDHMDFTAFVHNATGYTCWETDIEVPVY